MSAGLVLAIVLMGAAVVCGGFAGQGLADHDFSKSKAAKKDGMLMFKSSVTLAALFMLGAILAIFAGSVSP